ncbi:MAG: type II secretion system protein GspK [Verrucomicrobiae bacterium]|nr:type II secretion system protein GspK [Verrucomicrobiae bacterium]
MIVTRTELELEPGNARSPKPCPGHIGTPRLSNGTRSFTIIELLLAVGIFSMVLAAVYSTYSAILRASKAGIDAATDMQRIRIASRTIEDALVSAVMFASNPRMYAFVADTSGDHALLSFVARLPPSFPGSGCFGDQVVRRVTFAVDTGGDGVPKLILHQVPIIQTNIAESELNTIVLARDVVTFMVEFARQQGSGYEWTSEWKQTNQLPKVVRFALAFGRPDKPGKPTQLTVRTVSIPSSVVPLDSQAIIGRVVQPPVATPAPQQPAQPPTMPVPAPNAPPTQPQPRRRRTNHSKTAASCIGAGPANSAAKSSQKNGFAVILVLIVIVVLGILAGSFAFAMKVETRLAANAGNESELEWLGRSGVELARYVLGQSMTSPYTSLNQIWAGGPGSPNETNSPLINIRLMDNQLGDGRFSVRIVDLERRFNINAPISEVEKKAIINRALTIIGAEAGDAETIQDSILDWMDPDDRPRLSGTESDFYLGLEPAYVAKNGPIDDLAELLLIRGITPEIYWGPRVHGHRFQLLRPSKRILSAPIGHSYPLGLVDFFTPLSNGRININTAPLHVLQLLPGVDENVAANIIRARAGPDGTEGTEDDTPFLNVAALNPAVVPGIIPEMVARYAAVCSVQSSTFEVTVDAQIGNSRRTFVAVVRRNNPRDVPILQFSWY